MAVDVATLAIKVENSDVPKATASLNSLAVASDKTEKRTQTLTRRMALLEIQAREMDRAMGKSAFSLSGLATKMGVSEAAAASLTRAFGALSAIAVVGFIGRKTIEETEAAQAAMAQLEAAVASTGGAAGRSVAQLDALSVSLQKTTTFSDEAVKGAESMLLTFDKIRGAEFDRATAAVTDLAARMGGDLSAAAVQVGKALQDPTTGLTALRRSGVSFSQAQIEVIRQLYETGKAAEGQRVILAELEHQFGGSAAAARDTLGGALTGLKNAWGDLFEVSRGASQGTVSAINAITTALENSGLSMNKVLKDATVDWETMRASIEKVRAIMSLQIDSKFLENARNIIQRIDFDLSTKIAELNAPAKQGPATKPPPKITIDVDTKQAQKDLDALQKATDKYYNDLNQHQIDAVRAAAGLREQNAATREMIAATLEGPAAVEALTVAQAGANVVRQLGIGVSEKLAARVRREAEEQARLAIELGHVQDAQADAAREAERAADEAQREQERRAKDLRRATVANIEGILTDISNGRNPLIALAEGFKRAMIRAVSEALAERFLQSRFAAMLGIGVEGAAKKQDGAALKMLTAAKMQNDAADKMLRVAGVTIPGSDAPSPAAEPKMPSWVAPFIKSATVAIASGFAGYQTGQAVSSTSHGTAGNLVRGALGGAASGAAAGAAIGGLPGAIAGGVIGFVSGMLGASKAMKEAAKAAEEMRKALALNMDSLRSEVGKDALAANIAQVEANREQLRKQIEDAYSGGDKNSATVRERNRQLAELNKLEDERIRQLKEEAAVMQQRTLEDYQQRLDEATPGNERAEAIAANNRKLDREIEDLIRSFGPEIDAREREILAVAQAATAAEKAKFATEALTGAFNALTTSVNTVTGFKLADLNPYIQQYAEGRPYPGRTPINPLPVPTNPFVPPMTPGATPQLSRGISITIAPNAIVVNESKTPAQTADAIMNAVLMKVDEERNASGGINSSRTAAFDRMKLRPGAVQWRS